MVFPVQTLVIPALCFLLAFHLNEAYDHRRGLVSDHDATLARVLLTALIILPLYLAAPSLRPSYKQLFTLFALLLAASHLCLLLRSRIRSFLSGTRTSCGGNVLVFGTSAVARAAAREFERSGYTAIRFTESNDDGNLGQSLQTISRASKVIAETKPVRIVLCLRSALEELPMCELFEQQIGGVPVETGHEAYERLTGKIFLDERTPLHLLLSHAGLSSRVYGATKRVLSAVLAAIVLVAALPIMVVIALFIYGADGGAVLFVQERVGLHARPFRLLKFRSMRVENGAGSEWECDNEDRITPLGRWLRKFHLDELPQLWNILRGDMDLVGPRPHPVSNYELFARSIPYYSLRSLVRPGLTGWAQVRQGYAHDLPGEIEKMRYDLCAIARPSLLNDLWVLLATAKIVLVGHLPLEREAFPTAEKTKREDSTTLPFGARAARAPRPRLDPEFVENPVTAVHRQGFARLLPAVVVLSIAGATLQLIVAETRNTRSDLTVPVEARMKSFDPTPPTVEDGALTTGHADPTSLATFAATRASDLPSLDAAVETAKAIVQRSEVPKAKVFKAVLARRISDGNFDDGSNGPRYEAEVGVEIPRGVGAPIRRKYFVTLQYVGSGEWQIERAGFSTISPR